MLFLPYSLRKGIVLPKIVVEPANDSYGGYYTHGSREIVVAADDDTNFAATLSHEFCHYVQYVGGRLKPHNSGGLEVFEIYSYNTAIRKYFRDRWWELEALMFEYKYAKTELNSFWVKALVMPEDNKYDESVII